MTRNAPTTTIDDCWNKTGVRGDRSCERLATHTHCRNCEVHANAAHAIVQRELPPGYQSEWADYFAEEETTQVARDRSALVFRIGGEWLALPTRLSLSVADITRPHALPHRRNNILTGVVGVKGRLYPCVSLAGVLSIDTSAPPPAVGRRVYPRMLVMQFGQQAYALPVDDLLGIHHYAEQELEDLPATISLSMQRYLTGILRVGELRVGCLDEELVGYQLAGAIK